MSEPKTIEQHAQELRAAPRTVKRWIARGAPLDDMDAFCEWVLTQHAVPSATLEVCRKHRAKSGHGAGDGKQPNDWKALKQKLERKAPKDHAEQVKDLEGFRDHYAERLEAAIDSNDEHLIKFFNELLIDTSNSIRQQKLAADKLGIEEGQLFTKDQLSRVIRALAFWSMRAVDADLSDLCPKLVGKKNVNEARSVLEPALLSARFVKPFARAARVESESALSGWMVEAIRDAVDDYIENGAKEFEKVSP